MGHADLDDAAFIMTTLSHAKVEELPEETKQAAMRAVCGSNACKSAEDAKTVLMALGLIPDKETKSERRKQAEPIVRRH